jgi:proteasome lid subunit RPN8/RPN11
VELPRDLADDLIAHALESFPNECCGMIAGEGSVAVAVHRATNAEGSPFMYVMDPREQLAIMDAIEEAGQDMLAIYHSHTRSAAYPSKTDVELAFFPNTLYLIVSIADRDSPQIRAFRIDRTVDPDEAIEEEDVTIGPPAGDGAPR